MDEKGGSKLSTGRRLQGKKAALGEGVMGNSSGGRFLSTVGSPNTIDCSSSGSNTGPVPFAASEMKTRLDTCRTSYGFRKQNSLTLLMTCIEITAAVSAN